jgi:phosphoenolpyruvate-protein phosphotransferase (PTS system enzyme I)
MLELQGIPVSPGVAIGQALVFDREGYQIPRRRVARSESSLEWDRLQAALETAAGRLRVSAEQTSAQLGTRLGNIFAAQQQMIMDPRLRDELKQFILSKNYSAEYAVSEVLSGYAAAFRKAGPSFLADRAADIRDIERLILESLSGAPTVTLQNLVQPAVIASHDLTPGETAGLNPNLVLGLCMESGGPGGHMAIVARGMEIPAVVGIGNFLPMIGSNDSIIVDGHLGRVIINPDEATLNRYQLRRQHRQSIAQELTELRDLPASTSDGVRIQLMANIEFPHEAQACLDRGADGVGLYRTEFIYLSSDTEPSEEDHFRAYSEVVNRLAGKPVVMRTLDLGADKMGKLPAAQQENNPFLGLRSIRLSLRNPALFRVQVRAMLRAAMGGDIRIMFPMITTLDEMRSARFLLRSVAEDLREEGYPVRENVPVGMMVEVPAAVLMLDRFVQEVDFVSIGTNDLTQYALAVDRSNEAVADLYQCCDPAVLRLIQRTWEVAESRHITTSICGEMSSRPAVALLLVGMGIRNLSVAPSAIPVLKKAIRSVTLGQCQAMAWRAMQLATAREVDTFLQNQLAGLVPEMVLQA